MLISDSKRWMLPSSSSMYFVSAYCRQIVRPNTEQCRRREGELRYLNKKGGDLEKQSYLRHKARHTEFVAPLFFRIVLAYFKIYPFGAHRLKTWKSPKNFSKTEILYEKTTVKLIIDSSIAIVS